MAELAVAGHHDVSSSDEEQLVTMTVDDQMFGVPILRVQDIVEPALITAVPLAPSAVAGVLNLRGRIVTVIDLRVCLGAEPIDDGSTPMSVTVEYKGDLYTLLVDSIGDVRSLPRKDFDKPPMTLDPNMRRLCSGIFRLENDLLAVLDVDKVLDPETIANTPKRRHRLKRLGKTSGTKAAKSGKSGDGDPDPAGERKGKDAANGNARAGTSGDKAEANAKERPVYEEIGGELAVEGMAELMEKKAKNNPQLVPFVSGGLKDLKAYLTHTFEGPAARTRPTRQVVDDSGFVAFATTLGEIMIQMGIPDELIQRAITEVDGTRDLVLGS